VATLDESLKRQRSPEMGTAGHPVAALGAFTGGTKHRYRFRVSLDASADNNYQGDTSSVTFTWNAA